MANGTTHDDSAAPNETARRLPLAVATLSRWLVAMLLLSVALFLPAWTLDYWQAWVYIALLGMCSFTFIVVYLNIDPDLVRRRMQFHEREQTQQTVMKLAFPLFVASYVIPGLDRHFGWSYVPGGVTVAADGIVLLGYALFVRVMQTNRYAARVISVEQKQPVITAGPYSIVRHPMYVAALTIYVISPMALGSYWGMAASIWLIPIFVVRILNEESVLLRELRGYEEYRERTRYRLIPGIW